MPLSFLILVGGSIGLLVGLLLRRSIRVIAIRELNSLFFSPLAYVVLAAFAFLSLFLSFSFLLHHLSRPEFSHMSPMRLFLGPNILLWIFLPVFVSAITMRLFAEERRTGSFELLMTAPVTDTDVVLGKFLAAYGFYLVLWGTTLPYVLVVAHYGRVDPLQIVASYFGLAWIGIALVAPGVLASAVTRNQVIAAVLAFVMISVLWLIHLLGQNLIGPSFSSLLDRIHLLQHVTDFSDGVVDTRALVYPLSVGAVFLFATVKVLGARRWR